MRIVLDDQQDGVAGLEVEPVVRDRLDWALGQRRERDARRAQAEPGCRRSCARGRQWTDVLRRQVQRKRTAALRYAAQVNLAAEQVCEFAADRESEAGAAVFAAGRGVGLLECLEDDLLFLGRNADTGVGDLERHDPR